MRASLKSSLSKLKPVKGSRYYCEVCHQSWSLYRLAVGHDCPNYGPKKKEVKP
jgi:hypothetical protein